MKDDFSEAGRAGVQPGWRMVLGVSPPSQAELWPPAHVCPCGFPLQNAPQLTFPFLLYSSSLHTLMWKLPALGNEPHSSEPLCQHLL